MKVVHLCRRFSNLQIQQILCLSQHVDDSAHYGVVLGCGIGDDVVEADAMHK